MATENAPVESADYIEDSNDSGLLCFINATVQCGPTCMAYSSRGSESPTLDVQQQRCVLLVSVERFSRCAAVLVQLTKKKDASNAG